MLSSSSSVVSDLVFARVLDGLPVPLVRALREAQLDDASVLRDYPRAAVEELSEWLSDYWEKRTRSEGASIMETAEKQVDVVPQRALAVDGDSHMITEASVTISHDRALGGDSRTDLSTFSSGVNIGSVVCPQTTCAESVGIPGSGQPDGLPVSGCGQPDGLPVTEERVSSHLMQNMEASQSSRAHSLQSKFGEEFYYGLSTREQLSEASNVPELSHWTRPDERPPTDLSTSGHLDGAMDDGRHETTWRWSTL